MSATPIIRPVHAEDGAAISELHARTMGPGRFSRTAYRVREASGADFSPFCRVSVLDGRLIAAVRLTPVRIGGKDGALLLGPLAVVPDLANRGYGRALAAAAMDDARAAGIVLVVLVGDEPYYGRDGFQRVPNSRAVMPGPVDPERLLVAELAPGAFDGVSGLIRPEWERE
jgi:predicted N-acetyltransferase YhbS